MSEEMTGKLFTDRESGTYGGLMMCLREYRNRLIPYPGYKLNHKPRELDCLIIDKEDGTEPMDNDIARCFAKHNIVELKNPYEHLNVRTIWKVISYAAQYIAEKSEEDQILPKDVTITLLRAAKPRKAFEDLKISGYQIDNAYPGIYYIYGMADIRLQVVVTRELVGDDYVYLRIQRKNALTVDYNLFAEKIKGVYTEEEKDYLSSIITFGIYDEKNVLVTAAKGDTEMSTKLVEAINQLAAEREAEMKKRCDDYKKESENYKKENEGLKKQIAFLEKELKKARTAML